VCERKREYGEEDMECRKRSAGQRRRRRGAADEGEGEGRGSDIIMSARVRTGEYTTRELRV
jgi:hypothetical protein